MDSHLPRKRASRSASAAAAASRSGSVSTTATKAEPVPKPEAPIIDTHLVQRVLDENARLILDWIDLRKRVAAAAFSDVEQTTELRRVQLQLTENIDFLANLANQQGRRGGKLKVTLPPRFLRSASAALAEAEGAAVAVADAAVAAEAMAPPARWTAYIRAASSVALNDAGTIRRLLESAIEELREHSAGDAQQGALIAQLERALSSAVFDDAAAGGAQKMANAVARDWQSASFPGVYTQFELPPPAARLRRRAPPFTTMMQGLSYRRAARVRTSDRERQPRMKIARTDGGDLTFALPPPAPPAQPSPATRAAAAPVTVAAAPAAASALTGAAAASGGPRTLSAAEAAVAVAAVAAVASSAIPEDSDEMDEDYRLGVPAGVVE